MDRLTRSFAYDAWANELTLSSLRDQGDAGDYARRLFSHVLAAQLIWLARLEGEPSTIDVWPTLTIDQMSRYVRDLPGKWESFLAESADHLDDICSYTNSAGLDFETSTADILMHVIAHSAYHRGQVALELRRVGLKPAVTDFIAYTRR